MSRFGESRVIKADWWDQDEDATFVGKMSFLEMHRINYYRSKTAELGEPSTEEEVAEQARLMCRTLLVALVRWRLREPVPTYEEAQRMGVERKIVEQSTDGLIAQPFEDIAYMYREIFPRPVAPVEEAAPLSAEEEQERAHLTDDQRAELATTHLTPAAAEAGLTKAGFPDQHANPVHLPRRRRA